MRKNKQYKSSLKSQFDKEKKDEMTNSQKLKENFRKNLKKINR